MKLTLSIATAAIGLLTGMAWQAGERSCCLTCQPYADKCLACKDCSKCHWCSVKGGTCSVCLEKK